MGDGSTESANERVTTSTTVSSWSTHRPWPSVLLRHLATVNHLRQLLLAASVVLLSLLLAGCTTDLGSVKEIYILSYSYQDSSPSNSTNTSELSSLFNSRAENASSISEVRSGYLGLCATADSVSWACALSASDLASALNATGYTDPLNLLWIADGFRAQAVTPILTFLAAILISLAFTVGMVCPKASNAKSREAGIWSRSRIGIFVKRQATTFSFFFMVFATGLAFTVAAWQHLAAACSTGLADELAFGAIAGHTGPTATALAWLSFVCAASGMVWLGLDKGLRSRAPKDPLATGSTTPEIRFDDDLSPQVGLEAPSQLDPEEQPPLRHPGPRQQMPAIPLYHFLQFMGYVPTGRKGEWEARQHNTAEWVRREEMHHGFAETIVEDESNHS